MRNPLFKQTVKGLAAISLLSLVIIGPAQARGDIETVVYAPVVRVYPIKQTEIYRQPREKCYREQVEVPAHASPAGTVVGGLLGAAIGNKLGHGSSNRKIGTVAGAVVGATVGNSVSQARAHSHTETRDICETVYDESTEERVVGYDVEYRYAGHSYTTRMDHDPGKEIRLRVNAYPDE